ncbi:hypothetical protein CQW23_11873 [Capsicum baccatum]|uniref:Uncharacterized protein n=1 Tax=Capsicum baccatum TaxID=33114 RepID=A0A2G2WQZ5_CAPBA|nr:hypothetical protein CQW23_11873 [Capsicum baccatum]
MLLNKDITKVIERIEIFYFLVDIVLKDEIREEGAGFGPSILGSMSSGVTTFITNGFFHLSTSSLRHGRLLRKISMLAESAVDNGRLLRKILMQEQGAVNSGRLLRIISMLVDGIGDISIWLAAEDNTNASGGSSRQGNVDG